MSTTEETWFSIPEVAEEIGCAQRDIRNMIADNRLIAIRRGPNNALAVSSRTIIERDGVKEVLPSLRGTLIALKDARYTDNEAWEWLTTEEPELGEAPIDALRGGRIHGVRRVARMLGF